MMILVIEDHELAILREALAKLRFEKNEPKIGKLMKKLLKQNSKYAYTNGREL